MTAPSEALARVRKLLALAGSPNPHEAALAAARAQELIERHRLQAWLDDATESADDPITTGIDEPLVVTRRVRTWKLVLADVLARANECVAYSFRDGDAAGIAIAGRASDRRIVETLWTWLVARIEWLSATAGADKPRRWHESFRIGVAQTVAERLRASVDAVARELDGTALVQVDPRRAAHRERLSAFVAERLPTRPGRSITVDTAAWRRGRRAGEALQVEPPADTEPARRRS